MQVRLGFSGTPVIACLIMYLLSIKILACEVVYYFADISGRDTETGYKTEHRGT